MANGIASAAPFQPNGKNRGLPPSGSMLVAQSQLNLPTAPIQKTARIPSAQKVMKIENLKAAAAPAMFSPTKTA